MIGKFNRTHTPLILIIEDDGDVSAMYSDFLTHNGYRTVVATNGKEALTLAKVHSPNLALVDIVMPGMSGREVAAWLRVHHPETKIIFVTALNSVEVAVEEMHQGAFYYLTKPVRLQRLLETAVRAWSVCQAGTLVEVGDLVIDQQRSQVTRKGRTVPLTMLESRLLTCLVQCQGQETSYDDLWREVWDYDGSPDRGLIQRAMSRLREKLDEEQIVCVRGLGYRLCEYHPVGSQGRGSFEKLSEIV